MGVVKQDTVIGKSLDRFDVISQGKSVKNYPDHCIVYSIFIRNLGH